METAGLLWTTGIIPGSSLDCVKLERTIAAGVISRFQKQLEESEASDRSFGLIIGAAFVVIGLVRLLRHGQIRWWAVGLGAVLVLLAVLAPATLSRAEAGVVILRFLLGLVVNPLVLSILFFAVITPAAALLRLFGHEPLAPEDGHRCEKLLAGTLRVCLRYANAILKGTQGKPPSCRFLQNCFDS